MKPVFADTGYWIAMLSPGDDLRPRALALSNYLGRRTIITSEMVLTELLDDFSDAGEFYRTGAAQFVLDMRQRAEVRVVPQTTEQFEAALQFYLRRPDKEWSLTDCASILICQEEGVTEVLAYDRHFAQAGLLPLLRNN